MKTENIIFVGRLLEMPSEAPRCGDIKVAVGYKFRVQKLMKGRTKEKFVVVLVPCPEFKGEKFFVVNSNYLIEAATDLQDAGSYTIFNDYVDSPLFWSVNITKA